MCRTLAQRITCQSDDPVAQRVYRKSTERKVLASYVAGLSGVPGTQVRYASPVSVEEAILIAVSVEEADRQEKFNNIFYARHDSRTRSDSSSRHAVGSRTAYQAEGRRTESPRSADKARSSSTKNAQTKAALRCYECELIGHFARECPTRLKREQDNSLQPGRKNQTERSRRFGSPGEKHPNSTKQVCRRESNNSGNGRKA